MTPEGPREVSYYVLSKLFDFLGRWCIWRTSLSTCHTTEPLLFGAVRGTIPSPASEEHPSIQN